MQTVRQHWNLFSILILAVFAGWTLASAATPGSVTNGKIPAPREGFLAPDFELQTSQGGTIRLSSFRGKPVLVNVWASWCPPCKAEMPAIQKAYETYQKAGLVVLGVNSTIQDDPARAISFAQSEQLTFPILFDSNGAITRLYLVHALPTSFFIGKDGVIQDVVIGGPMSEASLDTRMRTLVGEKP
jgi:peroxiredoxin